MTLREYLKLTGMTQAEFAFMVGVTRVSVARYTTGTRLPTWAVVARISLATNGAVTANDFMPALPEEAA